MRKPHLLYVAFGFPPASKSCTYRMLATANQFAVQGWNVTVFNQPDETWIQDSGLDSSLLSNVNGAISQVKLNVYREELNCDIRSYSEFRAKSPSQWLEEYLGFSEANFPERRYGHWAEEIKRATLKLHQEDRVDLVIASVQPFVQLVANEVLSELGVPSVIDFRDAWSLNPITGKENFSKETSAGNFEERAIQNALEVWVVNEGIQRHYRERFPSQSEKIKIVRNGFDSESVPSEIQKESNSGQLHFGFLGVLGISPDHLEMILEGWKLARKLPGFDGAKLTFRGQIGAGYRRMNNPLLHLINSYASDGVQYLGPVQRSEVHSQYESWDVLLFAVQGGKYVTSAKIYEYLATGLPIVSSHSHDHGALEVSSRYPRNFLAKEVTPSAIRDAFREAAANIGRNVEDENELRRIARFSVTEFARDQIMGNTIDSLIKRIELDE